MASLDPGTLPESTPHLAALNTNVVAQAPPSEALPPIINDSPSMMNLRGGLWREDGTQPLSQDAQNVNSLHESINSHIQQSYADPNAAMDKWMDMANEGSRSGSTPYIQSPTDLGPLKNGVAPSQVNTNGLQAGLESYKMAPLEATNQAKEARDPQDKAHGRDESQSRSSSANSNQPKSKVGGVASGLNDSLNQIQYQIGAIGGI